MAKRLEQDYLVRDKGSAVVSKATGKIQDDLRKTEAASSKATASIQQQWTKVAGAIAATFGVMKLASFTNDVLQTADRLDKMSQSLGVSVEWLDKARQASDLGGLSFEQLTTSISQMTRNLDLAARGTGEQTEALAQLGLSARRLQASGPEKALQAIATQLLEVEDPLKRNQILMKLFGESGIKMVPMLRDIASGFGGLKAVIDTEAATNAARFNDELTKFRHLAQGLVAQNILPKLVELLQIVSRNFDLIYISIGGLLALKVSSWIKGIAVNLVTLVGSLGLFSASITTTAAAASVSIATTTASMMQQAATLAKYSSGVASAFASATPNIGSAVNIGQMKAAADQIGLLNAQLAGTRAASTSATNAITGTTAAIVATGRAAKVASPAIAMLSATLKSLAVHLVIIGTVYLAWRLWKGRTDELNESLSKTEELMKSLADLSDRHSLTQGIEEAYTELDRLLALRKDVQDKIDKIELRPDGSRSTITVGSPKDYEDLTKLNAEINELMGVIGDAQSKLNKFVEITVIEQQKMLADSLKRLEDLIRQHESKYQDQLINRLRLLGKADEAEIEQTKKKYADLITEAGNNTRLVTLLKENEQLELLELEKTFNKRRLDEERNFQDALKRIAESVKAEERKFEDQVVTRLRLTGKLEESEKQEVRNRYSWLLEENRKNTELLKILKENEQLELLEIEKRFADERLEPLKELYKTIAESFSSNFVNAFDALHETWDDSMTMLDNLEQAFLNFASTFLREMARMIAQQMIFNALRGAMGGVGGATGNFMGKLFGLEGFARGGVVTGPTPALIGEGGQNEAVVPLPDGRSIPVSLNRGSQSQIVINMNAPVSSRQDARLQARMITEEIKKQMDGRISYQTKPGGILNPQPAF